MAKCNLGKVKLKARIPACFDTVGAPHSLQGHVASVCFVARTKSLHYFDCLAFLVFWSFNCRLLSQTMTSRSTYNSRSAALSAPTTSSGSEDPTPAFSSAASPLADLGSTQMASSGLSQELRAAIQAAATEAALAAVRASLASASASATPGSASSVSCVPSSVAQDQLHATANGFLSSGSGLPAWTADNQGMSTSVPSFLSTFSLPSTPVTSVRVATPATASACPLPGAILPSASASGLSASFDEHFVVGPGFSPIPPKLVNQIQAGKYIDLSELLTPNLLQAQSEPQLLFDGRVVLTSTRKPRRKIEDIVSWCEAFTVFSLILTKTFPHRWNDLMAYKLLILRTYREFGGRVWLSYDRAFREHAAASKINDWSSLNVQLYNFHAAGASSRPHLSRQNSTSSEATGSSSSDVVCRSWNRGACSSPYSSCMFAHKCSLCRGSHRSSDCHDNKVRARDRNRSRSPSASRDGRTKKR